MVAQVAVQSRLHDHLIYVLAHAHLDVALEHHVASTKGPQHYAPVLASSEHRLHRELLVGEKTVPSAQNRRPRRRLRRLWKQTPSILVRSDGLYDSTQIVHVIAIHECVFFYNVGRILAFCTIYRFIIGVAL